MLTPSYLLHAPEGAEEIAEELHKDIIDRIIERVLTRFGRGDDYVLTAIDKWQIETLQQAGYILEDIQKEIAEATGRMQTEIAEAMEDAGVVALKYDDQIYRDAGLDPVDLTESPALIRLMQRDYEATLGDWKNFTGSYASAAQKSFISACDKAYHSVMTGSVSYTQAIKEALAELISDGVYVEYPSGRKDTIETATARAVRTGISQASAQIQLARMDEMDVDLVLVSSHLGARPDHQVWQGKVYSRTGNGYPDFVASTKYGSVKGLCGANCRHSFGPYFEGMGNPFEQYDSEENQKQYELEQRQRTLERRIRDTKRQTMNWKDAVDNAKDDAEREEFTAEYQRKAALLQKQNAEYNQFCKENGLKKQADRISIAKWDRSQAAKARAAAKKRIDDVGESAATGNWHTISVAGGKTDTKYRMITEPNTIDDNVAATNPRYKTGGAPYKQNCQRCVPAYEMRRRGYDVIAKPAVVDLDGKLSQKDPLYSRWQEVFKDTRYLHCNGADGGKAEIIKKMSQWGDGAVAEIRVSWSATSAHVFIAEQIDGNVRFIDPQTGNVDCEDYFTKVLSGVTMIARIDNLEPTELIEQCIKNRGGKQ